MVSLIACQEGDPSWNPVGPEDFSPWNYYSSETIIFFSMGQWKVIQMGSTVYSFGRVLGPVVRT